MKRTRTKERASGILCGDLHLRIDTPTCRTDDFEAAQWNKLDFISDLQRTHNCPVLCSGDLFHHWKPTPYLLSKTIEHLPEQFHTVYGNHDLPQHNINEQEKCGIFTLWKAGKLTVLNGTHWGEIPSTPSKIIDYMIDDENYSVLQRQILVYHIMTYQTKKPWPGIKSPKAGGLLRKYPDYDLILTGDNHQAFVEKHDGRVLVNPGSMMRQSAGQIDFKPRVYLYYEKTNTVEPVFLPIESGAVSRTHIERGEERDERIGAFIEKLQGTWDGGLNFEANIEEFFQANKISDPVKQITYKAIES